MENKFEKKPTIKKLFWTGLLHKGSLPIVIVSIIITTAWVYHGIKENWIIAVAGLAIWIGYIFGFHYRNAVMSYKKWKHEQDQQTWDSNASNS